MDFKDLSKITKKFDTKKLKKYGTWGFLIGLVIFIVIIIVGLLLLGALLNFLSGVFNFGVLGQWLKDFINGFVPGFVK